MTRFMNILASVAMVAVFSPIAANAMTSSSLDYVKIAVHKAISGPRPEVQHISVNFDAPTTQGAPIVQSGSTNQRYPDSSGG